MAMTVGFASINFQMKSVIRPIYDYAKREGYNVKWGQGGDSIVSCMSIHRNTFFMPHGVSSENFFATRKGIKGKPPLGILFPGPFWKEYFANPSPPYVSEARDSYYIEDAKKYPKERIKVVGWPKSDLIFSSRRKEIEEKWRNKLNLRYDKTVLLTHTYSLKDIVERTEGLEVNFIFKPHILSVNNVQPFFKGATRNQFFTLPEMEKRLKGFKHVVWVDPQKLSDITELFLVSDVVFTYLGSSIATEFMVTGKPVISFPSRGRYRVSSFIVEKDECPVICCGVDGVQESITRCLEKPDELKRQREAWLEKMVYKPDGNASERSWKAIMELVG